MKKLAGAILLLLLTTASAPAVILLDTADPTANTTAPAGPLADSGWQYQGQWGGWLGTPISPNFFVSAAHIGQGGDHFSFQGSSYSLVQSFGRAGSDLLIWQINETFPSFAPLYSKRDEVGQHLVVFGRGVRRGSEVTLGGTLRGWNWGTGDGVQRWGENDVAAVVPFQGHDLLYATFDQHVQPNDHPNESHLAQNDSGGAVFLNDNGLWKLAGINYAVDGPFWQAIPPLGEDPKKTELDVALFDSVGFYYFDDTTQTYMQVPGPGPVPTGFYDSRISSELAWICSAIANPQVGWEGNFLTVTYWRLNAPSTDIVYEIEQSTDLISWGTATTQDEVLSTAGDLQQIKAKVDPGTADHLFVRLSVTRP
jgi:hypothetical protein